MTSAVSDTQALKESLTRPEAFGIVYRRHIGAILRYLRRRLGDDVAEDAAHDVFTRAFRARATYSPRFDNAGPWLHGIAAHVVADHHRDESRRLELVERASRTHTSTTSDEPGRHDVPPTLAGALGQLSLEDRETLLLNVWGELSYDEVAIAVGVPVGTVRSRIARSRRLLQAHLTAPTPKTAVLTDGDPHA